MGRARRLTSCVWSRAGFILCGGPASVYEPGAPQVPGYVLESGIPVLGICYGMQALTHALGGRVARLPEPRVRAAPRSKSSRGIGFLPAGRHSVWMSHGDRIEVLPPGLSPWRRSAEFADRRHGGPPAQALRPALPPRGAAYAGLGLADGLSPWTSAAPGRIGRRPRSLSAVARVRRQVGDERVLAGVSGGVDSAVAAALVHRAVGDQLTCVFVDTGLMRRGEPEEVADTFGRDLGARLLAVNAAETFLEALGGVTDPEAKRRIVGETFIRVFEEQARARRPSRASWCRERSILTWSSRAVRNVARRHASRPITTSPACRPICAFDLVEPLRYLFKDEVRQVGVALGLPEDVVWRQPFPGPGLAVRCLGEVSAERLERSACSRYDRDGRTRPEADLRGGQRRRPSPSCCPCVRSGVMGDQRTYGETVALRAVATDDFMTADWARLPHEAAGAHQQPYRQRSPEVSTESCTISPASRRRRSNGSDSTARRAGAGRLRWITEAS